MTESERIKAALEVAIKTLKGQSCVSTLTKIDAILNPPPAYEEVEVVRWECSRCGTVRKDTPMSDTHHDCCQAENKTFIKLTGTYKRPVPQKVEKSVSVEVSWIKPDYCKALPIATASFEWEQLIGKHGTLTFTWQE